MFVYICVTVCTCVFMLLHVGMCESALKAFISALCVCTCECMRGPCVHVCAKVQACLCVHAYGYEPLAVIHREDMLTCLATTERIVRKLCVCVSVNVCPHAHMYTCPAACVCVCEVPLSQWKEGRGYECEGREGLVGGGGEGAMSHPPHGLLALSLA